MPENITLYSSSWGMMQQRVHGRLQREYLGRTIERQNEREVCFSNEERESKLLERQDSKKLPLSLYCKPPKIFHAFAMFSQKGKGNFGTDQY